MLEALVAANVQTQGVTIANDFQPIQVENPQTTTPTGSLQGKVEGGALVATAPGVTTGGNFVTEEKWKNLQNKSKHIYIIHLQELY